MPGILPARVVAWSKCEHCKKEGLSCDNSASQCASCVLVGNTCIRVGGSKGKPRIAQACDRCRSKKIRCDGGRPSCGPCVNVGFHCATNHPRSFRRGYTEVCEEQIRSLEAEVRELKELLDERDEKIDLLSRIEGRGEVRDAEPAKESPTRKEEHDPTAVTASLRSPSDFEIFTFDIESSHADSNVYLGSRQAQRHDGVSEWVEVRVREARNGTNPSIHLLIVETPGDLISGSSKQRRSYDELLALTNPPLKSLGISSDMLEMFGSVVFEKVYPDVFNFKQSNASTTPTFAYHIALGDFSLAFRYFPGSKTCVGILLVQDYKDIAGEILRSLNTHRTLIGEPLLLPLLAQKAMTKLASSWLSQHKETIMDAQAQTGFHHMVSLRKSSQSVDYSELSAKISGTAVNIATNQLCWQALLDHAKHMAEELREGRSLRDSEMDKAVASFMHSHASRLAQNAQAMLNDAASWQQKSLILVQGIFNLIAQQDQNTSIGIARDSRLLTAESKRDSTSMTVIAIVTMTYLPGTFVAVCQSHDMRILARGLN